jgi:hypothetical protein
MTRGPRYRTDGRARTEMLERCSRSSCQGPNPARASTRNSPGPNGDVGRAAAEKIAQSSAARPPMDGHPLNAAIEEADRAEVALLHRSYPQAVSMELDQRRSRVSRETSRWMLGSPRFHPQAPQAVYVVFHAKLAPLWITSVDNFGGTAPRPNVTRRPQTAAPQPTPDNHRVLIKLPRDSVARPRLGSASCPRIQLRCPTSLDGLRSRSKATCASRSWPIR